MTNSHLSGPTQTMLDGPWGPSALSCAVISGQGASTNSCCPLSCHCPSCPAATVENPPVWALNSSLFSNEAPIGNAAIPMATQHFKILFVCNCFFTCQHSKEPRFLTPAGKQGLEHEWNELYLPSFQSEHGGLISPIMFWGVLLGFNTAMSGEINRNRPASMFGTGSNLRSR